MEKQRWVKGVWLAAVLVLGAYPAMGTERLVPSQYATIQAAIDSAATGDVILISDGIYRGPGNRNISFKGKAITVRSENGPENCIIDCEKMDRGFIFTNWETTNSILDGLTITNGKTTTDMGAGIYCNYASPLVKNCILTNNDRMSIYSYEAQLDIQHCIIKNNAGGIFSNENININISDCQIRDNSGLYGGIFIFCNGYLIQTNSIRNCSIQNNTAAYNNNGGGIVFDGHRGDGDPEWHKLYVDNCVITNNSAYRGGGVFLVNYVSTEFRNCLFADNTASDYGGGICAENNARVKLINATFANNSANVNGGGASIGDRSRTYIYNSIFWGNSAASGAQIALLATFNDTFSIDYSNVQGGQAGMLVEYWNGGHWTINWGTHNLTTNPVFYDTSDYHLQPNSSCIDAGKNTFVPAGITKDLDGLPRFYDADIMDSGYGTPPIVDRGCYEFNEDIPIIQVSTSELNFIIRQGETVPQQQSFTISNNYVPIQWSIIEDCSWLKVEPLMGDSSSEADEITVTLVNTDSLAAGNYKSFITVSDQLAINNPQTIQVTLLIKDYDGVLWVPSEYDSIQSAIDISNEGDSIVVEPGIYTENIIFKGENIILTSTDSDDPEVIANTIIHGTGNGSVVTFTGGENASCQLIGFTITGGAGASTGGGIAGNNRDTYPTIRQCFVTGNSSSSEGGGIWGCRGEIRQCVFANNITVSGGGLAACHGTIGNCLICNNEADSGGAINNCDGNIINCTISQNTSMTTGVVSNCDGKITNCIIWGNSPDTFYNNKAKTTYSCVPAGISGTGNISKAPGFADMVNGDFRLVRGSPCIDAGCEAGISDDIVGIQRPWDYPGVDNNGTQPEIDMGAYEFLDWEPIANAGEDQTVERDCAAGAQVTLDGFGSVDSDGDELSYEWSWEGGLASGVNPTVTLPMGLTTVMLTVSDGLLSSTDTVDINVVDTTGPMVTVEFPTENMAVQDGAVLLADASDLSEIAGVFFSLREPDGSEGVPAGFEDLAATWNDVSGTWEFVFDSTQLPDGYYVVFARAVDEYGNEGISEVVPFSIRNWAILPMLPATPNSKAGRTMPVKFSLRMAESVDPAMPFVYNDELEIRIYDMAEPGVILQSAVFGGGSTNYRIDMAGERYMTNFKTKSSPATYVVEVWRPAKNFLVGSFTFKTVK